MVRRGAFAEAFQLYAALVASHPSNARAREGLVKLRSQDLTSPKSDTKLERRLGQAQALLAAGRAAKAGAVASALHARHPKVMRTALAMGQAHLALGQAADAASRFATAIALQPTYAPAYLQLGDALHALGQKEQAAQAYAQSAALDPTLFSAVNNLGATLFELKRYVPALQAVEAAIALDPGAASPHQNKGLVLAAIHRLADARTSLSTAVALAPDCATARSNLGNVLSALGLYEEAIAEHEAAVRLAPKNATAHNNLAIALGDVGRTEEARAAYRTALVHLPRAAYMHHNLSNLTRYSRDEPHLAALEALAREPLCDADAIYVEFSLGKAHDDLGERASAFAHFERGNAIRRAAKPYDADRSERAFARLMERFDRPPEAHSFESTASHRPVLIVGMPRSGTSLVEQILAAHSDVHGAGELPLLERAVLASGTDVDAGSSDDVTSERWAVLRDYYLEGLKEREIEEPVVTDKMPANFLFVGHAATALPEARIVMLERHPMAVCWSIYRRYFNATGHDYAHDLSDLAHYFRLHSALMQFWRQNLGSRVHTVRYEALTCSPQTHVRRLLAYCELPFQTACLRPQDSDRAVRTASQDQVRRPIYSGSSQAWRAYEAHLGPLMDALAPEIEAYEAGGATATGSLLPEPSLSPRDAVSHDGLGQLRELGA